MLSILVHSSNALLCPLVVCHKGWCSTMSVTVDNNPKIIKGPIQPVQDPCVGDLVTPVNSSFLIKALINQLPVYRQGLSPFVRGVQLGASFGYILYGPFTLLGPMRSSEFGTTIGLLSTVGAIHILTALFFLYGQAEGEFHTPLPNPTVNRPPVELFNQSSWGDFTNGFWLGGCGGSAFAWFVYTNPFVRELYQVFFGQN